MKKIQAYFYFILFIGALGFSLSKETFEKEEKVENSECNEYVAAYDLAIRTNAKNVQYRVDAFFNEQVLEQKQNNKLVFYRVVTLYLLYCQSLHYG